MKQKIKTSNKAGQYGGYDVKITEVDTVEVRSKTGMAESFIDAALKMAEKGKACCCELVDNRNAAQFSNILRYYVKHGSLVNIDVALRKNKVFIDARTK